MDDLTDRLRRIVNNIPDNLTLEDIVIRNKEDTIYPGEGDDSHSRNLYSTNDIAIALTNMPKGATFPNHRHNSPVQKELIIMLKGSVCITKETGNGETEKQVVIKQFEIDIIDKNILHRAIALEDCVFVAITVPRDDGYPR